jgi:hypothetical protein
LDPSRYFTASGLIGVANARAVGSGDALAVGGSPIASQGCPASGAI